MTPVGPVGPVIPVGPVAPVLPVGPVAPVTPVAPAGPVAPVAPAGPEGPDGPDGPVAPTPAGPLGPAGPSGPERAYRGQQRACLVGKAIGSDLAVRQRAVGAPNIGQGVDRVVDSAFELGQIVVKLRARKREILLLFLLECHIVIGDRGLLGRRHSGAPKTSLPDRIAAAEQCSALRFQMLAGSPLTLASKGSEAVGAEARVLRGSGTITIVNPLTKCQLLKLRAWIWWPPPGSFQEADDDYAEY